MNDLNIAPQPDDLRRSMNEPADSREHFQAAAILEELRRMRGSICQACAAVICGHEALMSLAAGYKNAPRCLSCLSRLMGAGREEVRDRLFGYITSRACRHAGWVWANREEATEPAALPACLWPPYRAARNESPKEQIMTGTTDTPPNPIPEAEWDAGNMGCGELVMGLRSRLQVMAPGQVLKLTATDPGAPADLPAWCRLTGHKLVSSNHPEYWIQRREK